MTLWCNDCALLFSRIQSETNKIYCLHILNLKDPEDDFVEAFANELNYSTDKALSTMVEAGYIAFDIDVYSDGTYEAEVSVY